MSSWQRSRLAGVLLGSLLVSACSTTAPSPADAPAASATSAPSPQPSLTVAASPTGPRAPTQAPAATPGAPDLALASTAFADGDAIPSPYTYLLPGQCAGENLSPPLSWAGVPAGTHSLAVILIDIDAQAWVHWVQFDIPPDVAGLAAAVGGPDVGVKGSNDFGDLGYGGPCPPGGTHRYLFTLYALDTLLSLPAGATRVQVESAMNGHVLDEAQLTGLRGRE